jgi:hypothetical protein
MSHHVDVRHMKKFQTQGGGGFLCWRLTLSANNVRYRFHISSVLPASYIQYGLRRVVNMKLYETNNVSLENSVISFNDDSLMYSTNLSAR